MRLHHIAGAEEKIESSPFVIQKPEDYQGKFRPEIFKNENPLYLEIGCGKGRFLMEMAENHPDINFLGIEKMSSVLIRAVEKQEEKELPNLFFLCINADNLTAYFDEGEIDKIYLNFSDPWPKDRHHKRRLTSREFLERYEHILKKRSVVEFKTDNNGLFDFSLEEVNARGWEILDMTRDLHHTPEMLEGNVMTEYEERFTLLGNKINKMIIRPKEK